MYREDSIEIGLFIMVIIGAIFLGWSIRSDDYKQGQIDVLTGTIKYELIIHPDSTKTWEEIGD